MRKHSEQRLLRGFIVLVRDKVETLVHGVSQSVVCRSQLHLLFFYFSFLALLLLVMASQRLMHTLLGCLSIFLFVFLSQWESAESNRNLVISKTCMWRYCRCSCLHFLCCLSGLSFPLFSNVSLPLVKLLGPDVRLLLFVREWMCVPPPHQLIADQQRECATVVCRKTSSITGSICRRWKYLI